MKKPVLILCIDRDNDLYEKAKVSSPLIGREKNLDGAMKLALADAEDPDSNVIFYAIKLYDQMRKEGENVEIVTLAGDRALGYKADKEISSQLDKIVRELNPSGCILISDGASDEEIIPIVKSRVNIDSTKIIFIKQAKELEKTYFVLIEKLRDPYYARTIIGIPAILLIMLALSSYIGWGWEAVAGIVGFYLLLRIFSVDELVINLIRDFRFSLERTSWIGYIGGFALFTISIVVGYQAYERGLSLSLSAEKLVTYIIGGMVWISFVGVILILISKSIDAMMEKKKYEVTKYMLYGTGATLSSLVVWVGSLWVVNLNPPYVSFGMFLLTIAASIFLGYLATMVINSYRKRIAKEMKIEGKEAINENGSYLGKIVGVDGKRDKIIIQTVFEKKYSLPLSSIVMIGDNVILRTTD